MISLARWKALAVAGIDAALSVVLDIYLGARFATIPLMVFLLGQ
jgi:hypothetical protein